MTNRDKAGHLLFSIGYIFLIISTMLNRVQFLDTVLDVLKVLSYFSLIISILLQYKKIDFKVLPVILLFVISLLSTYMSKDHSPLLICLILIAGKNIKFDSFIYKDYYFRFFLILFVLLMHFLGLTNDYIVYRDLGSMRSSMGFSHPNTFGFHLMILCFEYVYNFVRGKKRIGIFNYSYILLLLFAIDYFSDSRSSIIALILLFVYLVFGRGLFDRIRKSNVKSKIVSFTFVFCFLISLFMTYLFQKNNSFGLYINKLTSGRLFYANMFLNNYSIKPFGQYLLLISTEKAKLLHNSSLALVLDNSYIHILLRYGVFYLIAFEELFRNTFKRVLKNNRYELFAIFVLLLLYGLTETTILRIEMCPFLLYFSYVLFNKEGEIDGSNKKELYL